MHIIIKNNIKKTTPLRAFFGVVLIMSLVFAPLFSYLQTAEAAPNYQMNYQGKLTNASNVAVADGTYNMRFWLLTSPSIATTSALWTESLTGTDKVQVTNGLFSIMLGSTSPLTGIDFNQTLYLGVEIGGTSTPTWDGEMSPRKILGAVPAAFEAKNASTVGGVASTSFLRSDQADTASSLLTFTGGILSTASSTITDLTTLIATTTTLVINGEAFTDLTGSGLINSTNALTCATADVATFGCLTSTDWTLFNNKISTTSIDTSAELASIMTDETGTAGNLVFSTNPLLAGFRSSASSTIGDGTGAGGLTVSGNSTTTGNAYFAGNVGIGTLPGGERLEVSGNIISKGTEWTQRTGTTTNGWKSVTYGNGLFVAVSQSGVGNRVMTSPDGITWTSRTSAVDNVWRTVTYGNGLFVALSNTGTGNRIMTSSDGITWTNRNHSTDKDWTSVTYGNGIFAAVAKDGVAASAMTSSDGITWTNRTSASGNQWQSLTYGNGLFVAVSNNGTGNRVMTSPDGITWTSRTSAADSQWTSVTYGNGLFVAVSFDGTVMTSPDGITWTSRTAAAANAWQSVTYGNGLFVAVSSNGTGNRVMTSPDGITWKTRSTSGIDKSYSSIIYGNGTFVAVAGDGTATDVMTSGKSDYTAFSAHNIYQGGMSIFGNFNIGTSTAADPFTIASTSGSSLFTLLANGNVGIGTSTPARTLSVAGSLGLTGAFYDGANSAGTNGMVLQTTGTGVTWTATSSLGIAGVSGGTDGYLARFTGATTLATGLLIDNGTVAGVNATTSTSTFNIRGTAGSNAAFTVASSTGSSLFNILANGNVGIGTSSPSSFLTLVQPNSTSGSVGNVITAVGGNGTSTNGNGGGFTFTAGNGFGAGTGGAFSYTGGAGGATGNGGAITLTSGAGGATSGIAGDITISGGNGPAQTGGGSVVLRGGTFSTYGASTVTLSPSGSVTMGSATVATANANGIITNAGAINLTSGNGSGAGIGGAINITAGNGGATNVNGSNITLLGGAGGGTGTAGNILLATSRGLVGIGTTTPSAMLTIQGTTTQNLFTVASSTGSSLFNILASGNVGIGTSSPSQNLTVAGNMHLTGSLYDSTYNAGTNGMVLQTTGTGVTWVATSTLGITGGAGVSGGTDGYLARFTGATTLSTGLLMDNGTVAGVNATTSTSTFNIRGTAGSNAALTVASSTGASLFNILANGNVGIGSSTANSRLTVSGGSFDLLALSSEGTLGSELITAVADRDFSGANNWSGTNWSVGSGVATHVAGNNTFSLANGFLTTAPVAGNYYQVTFSINTTATGTPGFSVAFGGTTATPVYGVNADGSQTTQVVVVQAANTGALTFTPNNATWTGTIDNVSVKQITPSAIAQTIRNADGTAGVEIRAGGTGLLNTFVGKDSGLSNTTGNGNSFVGTNAGRSNTSGSNNSAQGYQALFSNTTANQNSAQGALALYSNTSGASNSAQGYQTLYSNTSGASNSAQGVNALYANTTGSQNSAQGVQALYSNTIGWFNSAQGYQSLRSNTTGSYNSAQGYQSLFSNISGASNSAQGASALYSNTTGSYNTANGKEALYSNTTGSFNSVYGADALLFNVTGSNNSILGVNAGYNIATSNNNTLIGTESGYSSASASSSNNTLLGYRAGYGMGDTIGNLFLGYQAASSTTLGNYNILLGYNNSLASTTGSNQLNIGNLIYGTGLGVDGTLSTGNVGIGTTTPSSRLTIDKTGVSGSVVAGMKQYFGFTNSVASAVYYGDETYIVNAPTATSTLVGKMIRIEDNSTLGNTVRGFEAQAYRGTNTKGENTGLSGFGRTFGVRGTTIGDAGDTYLPAGVFAESQGTTQGNALRAYSGTITTESLVSLFHDTSVFSGTGLQMNFGNSGGSFAATSSAKFLDFKVGGTSRFTIAAGGTTTIGDGTTNNIAGLQIGYGGLCVDNDGSCNASTTGRITSVSSATGNSDLAEIYFGSEILHAGEIVSLDGGLSIERASEESASAIIGVVSTKPGLLLGFDDTSLNLGEEGYPVGLKGRVPVKLSTENGPIKKGDRIAISSIPGIGMKATESSRVVGIALEDFDGEKAYSAGFLNQFGDDMVRERITKKVVIDPKTQDGCYNGGGVALGEEGCDPDKVKKTTVTITTDDSEYQDMLATLVSEEPQDAVTEDGETTTIGQALMFIDLAWYQGDTERLVLSELTSTSSLLNGSGTETVWDRLKALAQGFVDGVLSVLELKANRVEVQNELCVDGVCVNADDLRVILEKAYGTTSGGSTSGTTDGGDTDIPPPSDPVDPVDPNPTPTPADPVDPPLDTSPTEPIKTTEPPAETPESLPPVEVEVVSPEPEPTQSVEPSVAPSE